MHEAQADDLDFLFGSWVDDPEVDQALSAQRNIDQDLWPDALEHR